MAVINLELTGCQPMRAFSTCLDSINPIPSVCGALLWVWPECSNSSPMERRNWPVWIHFVSAIPRRLLLCLLISITTMDAFPCSYIVLTFQATNTMRCFGERRYIRCCWLCLGDVMRSQCELPPTRQLVYVWCFICFCNSGTFTRWGC